MQYLDQVRCVRVALVSVRHLRLFIKKKKIAGKWNGVRNERKEKQKRKKKKILENTFG